MKYKYIGTESQLIEHGFRLEQYEGQSDRDYLRTVNDNVEVYVNFGFTGYGNNIMNNFNSHGRIFKSHIQDLIDAKLVEVVE